MAETRVLQTAAHWAALLAAVMAARKAARKVGRKVDKKARLMVGCLAGRRVELKAAR